MIRARVWARSRASRPGWPRWPAWSTSRSSAPPTCRSCIPRSSAGCCARSRTALTWGCPSPAAIPQPLAAAYRIALGPVAERLVAAERLRPAFLFDECSVDRLDESALRADPMLAAFDPALDSVVNVNEPADYQAARAAPAPEVTIQRFGALADGHRGPQPARAATVAEAAASRGRLRRARAGRAERRPAHPGRRNAAGRRGHRVLPVRRRWRLRLHMSARGDLHMSGCGGAR